MKLCVFGSRSLITEDAEEKIENILLPFLEKHKRQIEYVCVPDIQGACNIGKCIALKNEFKVLLFPYKRGEGRYFALKSIIKRSKAIVEHCNYFILFHDGVSKGTIHDLELIKKAKKEYEIHTIKLNEKELQKKQEQKLWRRYFGGEWWK